MKKILLSFMLIGSFLFGKAQVVFNEISPNPDGINDEYLELFNTGTAINLKCYILVAYDKINHTAWIYRFPDHPLGTGEIVVLTSSTSGSIDYKQNKSYSGDNIISWNSDGTLAQYERDGTALVEIPGGNTDDILLDPSGSGGIALFLFDASGTPINGFVGASQLVLPPDFATLDPLTLPADAPCDEIEFDFSDIQSSTTEFQSVTASTGKDNGYYRTKNGLCGTWQKSSADKERSPGTSNGASADPTTLATVTASSTCPTQIGQPAIWNGTIKVIDAIYLNATYAIYDDQDFTNSITEADGAPIQAGTISDLNTLQFGPIELQNGHALLVRVNAAQNCVIYFRAFLNECALLPVKFKSFNASRTTASNVAITWITASEQNSKGFNVQKNVGGEWKTIAFVPSQAQGGNSSSDLTYSYRDANNEKGITQYRIQQVDLDGNAKYSDIRAIRGEGTVGKIVVYPNPSVDGKLNLVFEDNSAIRDVQVNDMQGRVVKSYKGISNNILVIEKLTSGFYTIRITNRNTAATAVEKVVVK